MSTLCALNGISLADDGRFDGSLGWLIFSEYRRKGDDQSTVSQVGPCLDFVYVRKYNDETLPNERRLSQETCWGEKKWPAENMCPKALFHFCFVQGIVEECTNAGL